MYDEADFGDLRQQPSTGVRRWSKPGIPHYGWEWVNVEDLKEAEAACEMCDNYPIRYLHEVFHRDYGTLQVGQVCAAKMTQSEKPKHRERELRIASYRRRRFPLRDWERTRNGNFKIELDGVTVVVFEHRETPGRWGYRLNHPRFDCFGPYSHDSKVEAMLEAFDYVSKGSQP